MNKKILAFTLAEVLITLAIIGVVAAITIPSLMQSTQDAELKTAWKKTFAELSNATNILVQDNGGSIAGLAIDNNTLRDLYKPYLKYQKTCDAGSAEGVCWPKLGEFWYLDNTIATAAGFDPANYPGMVLNDGNLILFLLSSTDCTFSGWNVTRCGVLVVDVNGFKKPNKFGKDMYLAHLLKDKIKPYGTPEDNLENKCIGSTGTYSGYSCASDYLYK